MGRKFAHLINNNGERGLDNDEALFSIMNNKA